MNQLQEAVVAGNGIELQREHDVAVAVITPSGVYPSEDEFQRVPAHEKIEVVLAAAAAALELTNTADWVVKAHDRKLHPHHSFHDEHLHGIVNIEWHKPEGGVVHPALSRVKFEEDVAKLGPVVERASHLQVHSSTYPVLDVTIEHSRPLRVRMDASNWDEEPPSVALLNADGSYMPQSAIPGGVFNPGPHPTTNRPFVCMRGTREFHTHSGHLQERWEQYRGQTGMGLIGILMQLANAWREYCPMSVPVQVPATLIEQSLASLRDAGRDRCERVVFWLGRRANSSVSEIYVPQQSAARDYFHISADSMAALMTHLRVGRLSLLAQIHSHPGKAFHSEADDTWAVVRHRGALSVVVPYFGADVTADNFSRYAEVFQLSAADAWERVDPIDHGSVIAIL